MKGFTLQPLVVEIAAGIFKVKVFFFLYFEFIRQLPILLQRPKTSERLTKHHWIYDHINKAGS